MHAPHLYDGYHLYWWQLKHDGEGANGFYHLWVFTCQLCPHVLASWTLKPTRLRLSVRLDAGASLSLLNEN